MQAKFTSPSPAAWLHRVVLMALLIAGLAMAGRAQAQFSMVPAPQLSGPPRESQAEIEKEYRIDGAKHLYAAYDSRIYRGKLPPLLFSVMIVETEIDATGQVANVSVVRKPAAAEVAPWVVSLIRRASPFPAPSKMAGGVRYTEIWLVDRSGKFQVDTLTEGQR
jgi:protein TonB